MVVVDPNALQAAQGAGKLGLLGILSRGFLILFFGLLILNSIYIVLEEKSVMPVLKNLGDTFLLNTQHISEISQQIVTQGGAYVKTDNFWSGVGNYIWMFGKLFLYLYSIYAWIWLIMLLLEWGPLYTGGHKFTVLLLALGIFFVLQAIILLGNAGVTKEIDCFTGCGKSVIYYVSLPVMWIKDLFLAIPYIIQPGEKIVTTIMGNQTI